MAYDALFQPIQVGPFTVKNRIMMTPHWAGAGDLEGNVARAYMAERAKSGVGWIMMNSGTPHPSMAGRRGVLRAGWDGSATEYLKKAADVVRPHGTVLSAIILHSGHNSWSTDTYKPSWAPSPLPSSYREMPIGISKDQIDDLVEHYALTAKSVKDAGLHSVEIQTSVDYLLGSFLSPALNVRTDEYGGPIENRARIILRIAGAIREMVGPDMGFGIRTSADHKMPHGFNPDDAVAFAKLMDESGLINYIAVMVGSYYNFMQVIPGMRIPYGNAIDPASRIKAAVSIPVIVSGRLADFDLANEVVASGRADMVAMAREHLADGEIVRKLREDRAEDIRPCIHCNHCAARLNQRKEVQCVVNPAFGFEREVGIETLVPQGTSRKVVVIGGGPAGMEAARVAAMRGHSVTLYEAQDHLGGQFALAARAPHRDRLGDLTSWQAGQLAKLGVAVHLNHRVRADDPIFDDTDDIIVATGSSPSRTGVSPLRPHGGSIPGTDSKHVCTAWDALLRPEEMGDRIVVYDEEVTQQGPSVALHLAGLGKKVTIVTSAPQVGVPLLADTTELPYVIADLLAAGVTLQPLTLINAISGPTVYTEAIHGGAKGTITGVDNLILITNNVANDALVHDLKSAGRTVTPVGDCVTPRRIQLAMYEGYMAGWNVGAP